MTTARPSLVWPVPRRRRRFSLAALFALWRQRRDLDRLDTRMLRDIGLTENQARTEARRAFWDAPDHWSL